MAANEPIHVLTNLYWNLGSMERNADTPKGAGITPFAITTRDAARAVHASLNVPLPSLPSRTEVFFIMVPSLPHGKFAAKKAQQLLGWEPLDTLTEHYSKL